LTGSFILLLAPIFFRKRLSEPAWNLKGNAVKFSFIYSLEEISKSGLLVFCHRC